MTTTQIYTGKFINGTGPFESPIWIIGEAPGEDEYNQGLPFVGLSGSLLINCLSRNGLLRGDVRLENLCGYRPYDNKFEHLVGTNLLADSLAQLKHAIERYKPVCIIACGNYPMHYLTGKGKWKSGKVSGIGNFRGSILPYVDSRGIPSEEIKVVPTYHPALVARERKAYPIFDIDIRRGIEESRTRGCNYTRREYVTNPRGMDLEYWTGELEQKDILSIDIESVKETTHILCVGFSPKPDLSVTIVPGTSEQNRSIGRLLESPAKKVFQFGTFDTTVLGLNGYTISKDQASNNLDRIFYWDTYVAQHILAPELPRDLGFLTSIYTREPYYKTEGRATIPGDQKGWSETFDREALYRYNGKDCCVTMEIALQQMAEMTGHRSASVFDFQMTALEMLQHISLSGMLLDIDRLELFKKALVTKWAKLQFLLNGVAGDFVNVRSSKQMPALLYDKLGLPTKVNREGRVTTDDAALVSLLNYCKNKIEDSKKDDTKHKWSVKLAIIKAIREIREIRQRLSMYVLAPYSIDGRSRATYKFGPETGRCASSGFVDGTGYNHQTNPRDPIEVSDEDYEQYKNAMDLLNALGEEDRIEELEDLVA